MPREPGVPAFGHGGLRFGHADGADGHGRNKEADRVHGNGSGAPDRLDEPTGDTRTGHRGHLRTAGELRVALHQVLPPHQCREKGLVGDVEKNRQDATGQGHDEELDQCEAADGVGQRYRAQGQHPAQVGDDHHSTTTQPVHPDAGRETDDEEGRSRRRGEQAHFECRGVQGAHRQKRNGKKADLRAQLADGLAAPEPPEVAVAQEDTLGHRRTITRGRHAADH